MTITSVGGDRVRTRRRWLSRRIWRGILASALLAAGLQGLTVNPASADHYYQDDPRAAVWTLVPQGEYGTFREGTWEWEGNCPNYIAGAQTYQCKVGWDWYKWHFGGAPYCALAGGGGHEATNTGFSTWYADGKVHGRVSWACPPDPSYSTYTLGGFRLHGEWNRGDGTRQEWLLGWPGGPQGGLIRTPPAVPTAQLFGVAGGRSLASRPAGEMGDPVNSATGSLTDQVTDLSVAGVGVGFDLTRTYNSGDSTVGDLGRGWVHNWETRATTDSSTGAVSVRAGDGQRVTFPLNANGGFSAPPGAHARLSRSGAELLLTHRDQSVARFDSSGRLVSLVDRNGVGQTATYDAATGRLALVSGSGRSAAFRYDEVVNRLVGVALSDGRSVEFGYSDGLLTSVRNARGRTTNYAYDGGGRLVEERDPAGNYVHRTTYNATTGRVAEQLDPRGKRTTFAWNASLRVATVTDPAGGVWQDEYYNNVLTRRADPRKAYTNYYYNEHLNLAAVKDALGRTTSFEYDAAGNLTRTVAHDGRSASSSYNARNDVTATTDASGRATTYGYDAAGNLTSITDAAGKLTQYQRVPGSDLLAAVVDPTNRVTRHLYDTQGNRTETVDAAGGRTTFRHDAAGRVTSTVEPRGNVAGADPGAYTTSFTYDEADNPISVTSPLGHSTSRTYNDVGLLATETDAKGQTTTYSYDEAGSVTSVRGPDPSVPAITMTYDNNGHLLTRTDAKGHTVTYGRNVAGQVERVTDPLGTTTLQLDLLGAVVKSTDPSGASVTYTRDVAGRPTLIDYSDTTADVAYEYDAAGRRTAMTDGAGRVTYTYDTTGRLQQVARGSDVFTYAYDDTGRVVRVDLPANNNNSYTYDAGGRVRTAAANGVVRATYDYDPAGRLAATTLPATHGGIERRVYDAAGRLTAVTTTKGTSTLARAAYTLDEVGNPLRVVDESAASTAYTYDALDRLTAACFGASTCDGPAGQGYVRYKYDANNNIVEEQRPTGTHVNTYNTKDQLVSRQGPSSTASYVYDARGNTVSVTDAGKTTSYAWTLAGRLKSATVNGTLTTYTYDGDGRRLTAATGRTTTGFVWDPSTYDLALERSGNSVARRYLPNGIGIVAGNTTSYRHADALGSTQAVTSAAGALEWSYDYEPYGALTRETKHSSKATANPLQFVGEYKDATGLVHLRARQLNPSTGRFLSLDPLGGGYAYANGNPMLYVDPLGLWGWRDAVGIIGKGAGYVSAGASVVALGAAATGVGAPVAAVAGTLAGVTGAVAVGAEMMTAADACVGSKGGCVGNVAMAAVSSAAGKYVRPARGLLDEAGQGTERVQRWMSRAELEATEKSGLVRGGRGGTHFATDAANHDPRRARQRLALPQTPEVRVELEVPRGTFSAPSTVAPANGMPGGGLERTAEGDIPCRVVCTWG